MSKANKNQSKGLPEVSGKKLTQPLALEDGRVPGLLRNLTYIVCVIIGAGIIWASVSEIRELAIGQGEIVPTGSVKTVHHLEGGIIEEVLTQEGQIVNPGTPVLRLSPVAAVSDLKQLESRMVSIKLRKHRLLALLKGGQFTLGDAARTHPSIARDQMTLFKTQIAMHEREKKTLNSRIKQREADIKAFDIELESQVRQVAARGDQLKIAEQLYKKKLGTRSAMVEQRSEYEEVLAKSLALNGKRISTREALEEARSLLLESEIKLRQAYTEELTKASIELSELTQNVIKQRDKVTRLIVRSPVRGTIQDLPFHTKGEVIKPGGLVAKIVPVDGKVVAEIRLNPKDIGHVKVGNNAELKISTFDPNVFGIIAGKVDKISASSFQSERGEVYFKAIVSLEKNTIGRNDSTHMITSGMQLEADIVTGSKTLVQYMLKPVYRSLDTAFSER